MFNIIKNYINDNDFKINLFNNSINIVNYIDISSIDSNKIIIKSIDKLIIINGVNLKINKLLENELLITGEILSIIMEKKNV